MPKVFVDSIPPGRVLELFRVLAAAVGAGVPLPRALEIAQGHVEGRALAWMLERVRGAMADGASFATALAQHPAVVPRLIIGVFRAAEAGPGVERALAILSPWLERALATRGKVRRAMAYPLVVLGITACVVLFIVAFVLPQFKSIFNSMCMELPFTQKVLFAVSDLFQDWWFLILPGIVTGLVAADRVLATSVARRALEAFALRLPVVGEAVRAVAGARFTRTLGTALAAGVPIIEALDLTAEASASPALARAVRGGQARVREGESIGAALEGCRVLPAGLQELMSEAEERDSLDAVLLRTAGFYDAEVDRQLAQLTQAIEPIVIVFMGLVIGGIVLTVFMPHGKLINNVG